MTTERPECLGDYRNNCVLVALKEVSGRPDHDIFDAVRRHNYKNNRGMYKDDYMAAAADLGIATEPSIYVSSLRWSEKPTVARVIRALLQEGTWLVRTIGHILVVKNGRLIDKNMSKPRLGRRVVDVTRVLNPHVPQKSGYVRVVRHACRRRGTTARARFNEMAAFLARHPRTTRQELLAAVDNSYTGVLRSYDAVDFEWDLSRGNIEIY